MTMLKKSNNKKDGTTPVPGAGQPCHLCAIIIKKLSIMAQRVAQPPLRRNAKNEVIYSVNSSLWHGGTTAQLFCQLLGSVINTLFTAEMSHPTKVCKSAVPPVPPVPLQRSVH